MEDADQQNIVQQPGESIENKFAFSSPSIIVGTGASLGVSRGFSTSSLSSPASDLPSASVLPRAAQVLRRSRHKPSAGHNQSQLKHLQDHIEGDASEPLSQHTWTRLQKRTHIQAGPVQGLWRAAEPGLACKAEAKSCRAVQQTD